MYGREPYNLIFDKNKIYDDFLSHLYGIHINFAESFDRIIENSSKSSECQKEYFDIKSEAEDLNKDDELLASLT